MPRYDFICIDEKCLKTCEIDCKLDANVRIGDEVHEFVCPNCLGKGLKRIWGERSPPFKFNMRHTPL